MSELEELKPGWVHREIARRALHGLPTWWQPKLPPGFLSDTEEKTPDEMEEEDEEEAEITPGWVADWMAHKALERYRND